MPSRLAGLLVMAVVATATATATATAPIDAAAAPNVSFVAVFTPGELDYVGMRIPSILLINSTLLAFCECGQPHMPDPASGGSYPNSGCDICSKTSTDGGASWSALNVVVKNSSQPSPVFDKVRNLVVLNYNGAPHCATGEDGCGFNMQLISKDGGVLWGDPTPLDQFLNDKGHSAAGPGVGLQLTHGDKAGRLLFIGHHGAYVWDSVWYSDDGGVTYETSDTILKGMDEAQLVENRDGVVIANMRHGDARTKGRAVATSTNSGQNFSKISFDAHLKSPVCQGSIIRASANEDIYFSNPCSSSSRSHGCIHRSKDGITWQESMYQITTGDFGYSCLTNVPQKDKLGLLWEVGGKIVFSTLPLGW